MKVKRGSYAHLYTVDAVVVVSGEQVLLRTTQADHYDPGATLIDSPARFFVLFIGQRSKGRCFRSGYMRTRRSRGEVAFKPGENLGSAAIQID